MITPEKIREMTNMFCRVLDRFLKSPADLKDATIVLERMEDGYQLRTVRGKFNRRDYVTVINIPEDLLEKTKHEAIIDLAGLISAKLAASANIINSNDRRSKETKSSVAKAANKARWDKA